MVPASPLPFPESRPAGYGELHDEPTFDPRRHLALEAPSQRWTLGDFGYGSDEVRHCASPVAVAGPFRLLSAEGAEAALSVARALRESSRQGARTANYLAGGVYRSRFLRELCSCREITDFLSGLAGCALAPHNMPSQQIYINYAPEDLSKAVDTWHTDSIGFDAVVLASDPAGFTGGEFEFFRGTRDEAAPLLDSRPEDLTRPTVRDLPRERVTSIRIPGAGYAVFQQGNLVVHRATRLERRGERNTMVIGYVARDVGPPDPTRDSIVDWGEPGIVAEFARHKAWLARAKLDELVRQLDLNTSPGDIRALLDDAIADARRAIDVIDGSR